MKILVQFPTFLRKSKFLSCIKQYDQMSSNNNEIFFNINCDYDDLSMNSTSAKLDINNAIKKNKYRINYIRNSNKINAINANINIDFDVVLCASDDMIPVENGWDKYISLNMNKYFPNFDGALHFNDGYAGKNLITLSILGRNLYNYFGYIYHPDYKSLYCDNEFTEVVYSINKVKYIDDIIIKHEHYSRENNINSGDYDTAAEKTLVFSGRDCFVYGKRKELGFPRERITND